MKCIINALFKGIYFLNVFSFNMHKWYVGFIVNWMRFDWQDMQNDLDREASSLQELEAQKQDAQDRLEEMDQQKAKLEDMLNDVRQKCQEESQMVSENKQDNILDPQMTCWWTLNRSIPFLFRSHPYRTRSIRRSLTSRAKRKSWAGPRLTWTACSRRKRS